MFLSKLYLFASTEKDYLNVSSRNVQFAQRTTNVDGYHNRIDLHNKKPFFDCLNSHSNARMLISIQPFENHTYPNETIVFIITILV